MKRRSELVGSEKAVAEVLDEINARAHGILSGSSYQDWFIDWLRNRGYEVVPIENEENSA